MSILEWFWPVAPQRSPKWQPLTAAERNADAARIGNIPLDQRSIADDLAVAELIISEFPPHNLIKTEADYRRAKDAIYKNLLEWSLLTPSQKAARLEAPLDEAAIAFRACLTDSIKAVEIHAPQQNED